jgi:nucleoid-associated protein YgaU
MKKILIGMAAAWISCSVIAGDVQLNDGHPDRHTVVKGDTLWDISETFLKTPWMWPEVWHANPQVENPHLIYPGDVIRLVYMDGQPRLVVDRGEASRTFKMSPQMRLEPVTEAISSIPLDKINNFLSKSRVVTLAELESAPHIVVGAEEHLILGEGDILYARGDLSADAATYGVYRKGQDFVDPATQEVLGLEALDIGSIKAKTIDFDARNSNGQDTSVGTFSVIRAVEEIRAGDRLLLAEERGIDSTFFPSAPEQDIDGQVMSVEGGVSQVGLRDVVTINKGERDGLVIGNVLAIYKNGGIFDDRIAGDKIKLPDEKAGLLMIFRTYEKMSYGLVLEASRPLSVKDKVRNP